ncbi:TauD/TfdA family dioxygenase [bacterium]|nr:TauD/TfdA family dioxygenase [bacterium]
MTVENMDYIQAKNGSGKIACYTAEKGSDIFNYVKDNKDFIQKTIHQYGGIILRNFGIRAVSEFSKLSEIISPNLLDYVNRSTPRTRLGGKIYTATEYPAHKHIPPHNENAYTLAWPEKLLFFCVIAPQSGGETPIVDSRQVLSKLDKNIVKRFNDKQVLYTRNYATGIDLSWQDVFQTSDKKEVEHYCDDNKIQYTWHDNADGLELTTKQICQATLKHPVTSDNVWFNQAHLFHVASLDDADRSALLSIVKEDRLPRNASYGDGSNISDVDIQHILSVYDAEKIVFQWQKGDVMILDNVLMAHARHPFSGERKIVVAMGNG